MARNSIKKGQVINPNGRPKGAFSEYKKKFIEIQKLAANDASEMYQKLKDYIEAGEVWAYQIYWKELYTVPKNHNEETIEVKLPEEINNQGTDEYLKTFIESLSQFESFTKDEINSIVKTLNSIKFTEQFGKQNNTLSKLTDEQVKIIAGWLEEEETNKI